jgi:hypothetical protein
MESLSFDDARLNGADGEAAGFNPRGSFSHERG